MPEVKVRARYFTRFGREEVGVGYNAEERPLFNRDSPSTDIAEKSMNLVKFMDGINKIGRSAYACAEAQALSNLLMKLLPPIDYSLIKFDRPTAEGGLELWKPCENCMEWLTEAGGTGTQSTYKLSGKVLELLSKEPSSVKPKKVELKLNDDNEFPSLG
jgi:hypothetical protein